MSTALKKRRNEVKADLNHIEKQIYDLETSYLEETKEFGNIFTGWDSYLSSDKAKQKKITLEDRLFSLSSVTSPASRKEENKKINKLSTNGAPGMMKKRRVSKVSGVDSTTPESRK